MTDETPAGDEGGQVRRRLQAAENPDTKGRSGCLVTGAILGIIFGLTFAFYGLPPILRHYYGEAQVAVGGTYRSGERALTVEGSEKSTASGNVTTVTVRVHAAGFAAGEPRPGRFRLEVAGAEDWIAPSARSGPGETFVPLPEGEQVIQLIFEVPGNDAPETISLRALHLEDPRVKFELAP